MVIRMQWVNKKLGLLQFRMEMEKEKEFKRNFLFSMLEMKKTEHFQISYVQTTNLYTNQKIVYLVVQFVGL